MFEQLLAEVAWQQDVVHMYGKKIAVPRLQALYGDPGTDYQYTGISLTPNAWTPLLLSLKEQIELKTKQKFNSVLINLYRDQNDTVGWHSDDEKELGNNPTIASLTLGYKRNFSLKHKQRSEKLTLPLASGSLFIMAGESQHYWLHAVPRSKKEMGPRINLTFRKIFPK